MRRQLIASLLIVSAMAVVVSMTLVAQDRFDLKAPNGVAFSEFKGYDEWQVIATRQPKPIVDRPFGIEFLDAGAESFAFTFG
jgi:hypothetical protein